MSPEEALEHINAAEHTTYTVDAQFSGGEDQGAFRVAAPGGAHAVLKINRNSQWISQINRAKAATNHLRALGYPVPSYTAIGSTDRGTYSIQSELPGEKLAIAPTTEQITALLQLIEQQKGQVISEIQGQDWCWYLMDVVFRGESGNVRALMQFSTETSALVTDIEGLVVGLQGKQLAKADIVHGDLTIGQILFQGPAVSGVLDWDQVGYGDRSIDLVSLWYSILATPAPRDLVMKHLLETSDAQIVKICAAYQMLTNIAWHINKPGGDVPSATGQARTAIDLLRGL